MGEMLQVHKWIEDLMFTNKGSDTRFLFKAYFSALKKLHVDTWTIKNKNKANKKNPNNSAVMQNIEH